MDGGTGTDTIDHTIFAGNYVFNMATGLTNFGGESFINFENANMGA
ncbi:calcium-binding protein, partial [Microcystis aeruginosa 11-30S32]